MRWDDLFAELEAQFEAEARTEHEAELAGLVHAEAATILLTDRIRHRIGQSVHVRLRNGELRDGLLREANHAWVMVHEGARRFLIPRKAISQVWPLVGAAPSARGISSRLTLGYALRKLAEAGMQVRLVTDGGEVHGRLGLVGADYCDVHTPAAVIAVSWDAILCIEQ